MTTGDMLGPYKLGPLLGRGGMGEVYRAFDTRLNRDVAIKILPADFADDPDRARRFQKEARAAGALSHPNILAVFDVGQEGETPFLVTELLEGAPLRERMDQGRLSLTKIADYGKQTAAGLAAAHDKGIFHRDIKPENLFLTKHGLIKILDFGLAKTQAREEGFGQSLAMTVSGSIVGTVPYMSPEQVLGKTIDGRSDLFSLGSVLYEMAAGVQPFRGETSIGVMNAIVSDDPVELSTLNTEIPPALDQVVRHCLEKKPEDRFQSVRDLSFALDQLVSRVTVTQNAPAAGKAPEPRRQTMLWKILVPVVGLSLAVGAAAVFLYQRWAHPASKPVFQRLTFQRGRLDTARFTPDSTGVIYSAQWENDPVQVFDVRFDSPGARSLGYQGAQLRAVSSFGELLLSQNPREGLSSFAPTGLLQRAPISGGAARPAEEKIDFADWSPDGKEMAVVRETDDGTQLEYPAGKVLYKTSGYIGQPRISPSGDSVAFIDHPLTNDNGGDVAMIAPDGAKKTLAGGFDSAEGLAWSPRGDEVWFTASRGGGARYDLRAVTLSGKERVILSQTNSIMLHDIAKDGRVLLADNQDRCKLFFHGAGESSERDLSWLDWSVVSSLSPDGKRLAFFESGEGVLSDGQPQSFIRETNGQPPLLLGPGYFPVLSRDGLSVVVGNEQPSKIAIYPVGTGQSRTFLTPGYTIDHVGPMPDGQHVWFSGAEPSHARRLYRMTLADGKITPISEEGTNLSAVQLSFDGQSVLAVRAGRPRLYRLDGSGATDLPAIAPGESVAGFTTTGAAMFVYDPNQRPAKVFRMDVATGRRELAFTVQPADGAGLISVHGLQVTPDGKAYTYSVFQDLSELHIVTGLK
jgi:Tol biopolymer transport system component